VILRELVRILIAHHELGDEMSKLIVAESICSIHSYLAIHGTLSPLTLGNMKKEAIVDFSAQEFEWIELAMEGKSPVKAPGIDLTLEKETWRICSSVENRLCLIRSFFSDLPSSCLLKVKCEFALGLACFRQNDLENAERFAFESILLLDRLPGVVENHVPLISELGENVLVLYGEILLAKEKYTTAIQAFETACACFKLRTNSDYHDLIRKLTDICVQFGDWKRALLYYEKIFKKSKQDENIHEVTYVSQQICKVCVEIGDFHRAEESLCNALAFVYSITMGLNQDSPLKADTTDRAVQESAAKSANAALYMRLAQLYLEGDKFDDAVRILNFMLDSGLSKDKVPMIKLMMLKTQMKNRQFGACAEIISEFEEHMDVKGHKRTDSVARFSSGMSGVYAEILESLDFLEAKVKIALHEKNFQEALFRIVAVSKRMSKFNPLQVARYSYLKAKVLQERYFASLRSEMAQNGAESVQKDIAKKAFQCKECHTAFMEAYDLFFKANDRIKAAKVLTRLSETYLQSLFTLSVFLRKPLSFFLDWMIAAGFDVTSSSNDQEIRESLRKIETPIKNSLDIHSKSLDALALIRRWECFQFELIHS
jgi:tetratricopeptide (TPR) repeat protein